MKRILIAGLVLGHLAFNQSVFAVDTVSSNDATIDGELMIIHIDYKNRKSEFAYHVKDRDTGEIVELKFDRNPPRGLHSGDSIRVRGTMADREIFVQDISGVEAFSNDAPAEAGTGAIAEGEVAGAMVQRKAIYMVINFSNSSNPAYYGASEAATAANRLFYDTFSVDNAYKESSFGNVGFLPPEQGGGKVVGPLSIAAPSTCDYYAIANLADSAAAAAGENLSLYNRKIYLIPPYPVSNCNWLALGQIGSYGSTGTRLAWTTSNDANALIHELGHNEGWHHAGLDADNNEALDSGSTGEYGDTSDAMGYCCSKRKFNAVHLDQIGWLPSSKVVTAVSGGIYHLEPVGNYPDSTCVAPDGVSACPQLLKIQKDKGNYMYNLSYRQVKGLDQSLSSTYTNGVNIHNGKKADIWSYHIKSLTDGQTFSDTTNGITIKQISHDASKVVVQVSVSSSAKPASPSGLVATAASTSAINLKWTDNSSDETGFKIQRSPDGVNSWTQVAQVGANVVSYQNTKLASSTTYYYRVYAYNSKKGASDSPSNVASATTDKLLPPASPSNLQATAVKGRKITLQWTDNATNEASYSVQRSTDNSTWTTVSNLSANSKSYSNNGLTASVTYYYRVAAVNAAGTTNYVTASAVAIP